MAYQREMREILKASVQSSSRAIGFDLGLRLDCRALLYSASRLSISDFGTARTCFTKSSNALNSFGFLMPSLYASRASVALNQCGPFGAWFLLPCQLSVRDALSNNAGQGKHEPVLIVAETFIETKTFFIQISEHVEWFNADIGSPDATLQKAPEVFDPVRVNRTPDIFLSMANKVMDEAFIVQRVVCAVLIAVNRRSFFHVRFDNRFNFIAPVGRDNLRANLALSVLSAIQQTKHGSLAESASSALNSFTATIRMHVASAATNVGFVHFDCFAFAANLHNAALTNREANAMAHVPRGFLGYTESAMDFVRTDSVLVVGDHPETSKPLVQWNRAVFKNRSLFNAVVFIAVLTTPRLAGSLIFGFLRTASRACRNTLRPSKLRYELDAKLLVGEVLNRCLQRLRKCVVCHDGHILAEGRI